MSRASVNNHTYVILVSDCTSLDTVAFNRMDCSPLPSATAIWERLKLPLALPASAIIVSWGLVG